jgi:hypothetical protein
MNRSGPLVLVLSSLLLPGALSAGPTKSGPSFGLSSCSACVQAAPAAAGNPAGSLFALWESLAPGDDRGVPARFFRPLGPARGADFFVQSASPASTLLDPQIAGDARSFVAVWALETGDDTDVFARRYTPRGIGVGPAIQVNQDDPALTRAPRDFAPAVAMAPGGGFVVAWIRFVPFVDDLHPGSRPAVFIRRFAADGVPLAAPLQLSTGLVAAERPGLCVTTTNAAAVAWTSVDRYEPFQPSLEGVSVRRLQPSGLPQPRTLVLSTPTSRQANAAVSCGADGGYVVAWSDQKAPALVGEDIVAQRFARDGKKAGAAFLVNSVTGGDQTTPELSHDSSGAFVAVWSGHDGLKDGIAVRRFTAAGAATGPEVDVSAGAGGRRSAPDVAHTGTAGNFVVVWQDPSRIVVGQRFKP